MHIATKILLHFTTDNGSLGTRMCLKLDDSTKHVFKIM